MGLMFADAEYCGSCGTRRSRQAEPAGAPCPGCRGSLHAVSVGDVGILECTECDGLWLDAAAFERICADREAQAAVIHGAEPRAPGIEKRVSYRPCVRCGTMMNRVNFGRLSGTIVDGCKGHGTFLDAGELQAIVGFIQGGGLDRARQRQIEELKEQQRRLKDQEARALGGRYTMANGPVFVDTGKLLGFDTLIGLFRDE
jgi:Zn-finger nucleic acid-binding protein